MNVSSNLFVAASTFDVTVRILDGLRMNWNPLYLKHHPELVAVRALSKPEKGVYCTEVIIADIGNDETQAEFQCDVKDAAGLEWLMNVISICQRMFERDKIISASERCPVRLELSWIGIEELGLEMTYAPVWKVTLWLGRKRQNAAIYDTLHTAIEYN